MNIVFCSHQLCNNSKVIFKFLDTAFQYDAYIQPFPYLP